MKIGEFARKYGITKNTVRYYIEHGLLVPEAGPQYQFGKREEEDIKLILKMKAQYFSLKEIAEMISLRYTSNMVEPYVIADGIAILEKRKIKLEQEIRAKEEAVSSIEEDIRELSKHVDRTKKVMGVPISALELLICPHCGEPLKLSGAVLDAQAIFEGDLSCSCGYKCKIQNGIIQTGNLYTGNYDWPDLKRGLCLYGGESFLIQMKKLQEHLLKDLSEMDLHGKVMMETNLNGHFFAYNHLDAIPEDCLYIVTDKFPEMLEMYKMLIEMLPLKRRILFIADADMRLPIKRSCVDILIDCMSTTEQSMYSRLPYIQVISPYLKDQAVLLGCLLGYHGHNQSQKLLAEKYPEGVKIPFSIEAFLKEYKEAGYQMEKQVLGITKQVERHDKYFYRCHVSGDSLYLYHYRANKIL